MKKLLLIFLCLPMIGFGQYLHNLDSVIRYSRDNLNNYQLWGKYKSEPTYDASNNMTLELRYNWNTSTNAWVEGGKYERTYDASNNNTLEIYYNWNTSTNAWGKNTKYERTYDASNNMTLEIYYNWNTTTNAWVEGGKYERTYDASNNNTLEIYYNWNTSTNAWGKNTKYERTYDASNNMTLEIYYNWNTTTNAWVEGGKYERTYDASNNNSLEIYYNWNTTTNAWQKNTKYEHNYDTNNNMTLRLSYYWSSNSWVYYSNISGAYYTTGICAYTLPDPGWAWGLYSGHNAWINEMCGFNLIANTHPMYHVSSYDSARYYYSNSGITVIEDKNIVINNAKELLLITDLLGRETKQTNQPLFYIYDNGTVEKRIVIE